MKKIPWKIITVILSGVIMLLMLFVMLQDKIVRLNYKIRNM